MSLVDTIGVAVIEKHANVSLGKLLGLSAAFGLGATGAAAVGGGLYKKKFEAGRKQGYDEAKTVLTPSLRAAYLLGYKAGRGNHDGS